MKSLLAERDTMAKISTWPWDAGTFNAFVTTLILPIVVWLLRHLLERHGL